MKSRTGSPERPRGSRRYDVQQAKLAVSALAATALTVACLISDPPEFLLPGPDPAPAPREKSWPTSERVQALRALDGMSRKRVVQSLGHPMQIEKTPDPREVLTYPWLAIAIVSFEDGLATGSFYDSGYRRASSKRARWPRATETDAHPSDVRTAGDRNRRRPAWSVHPHFRVDDHSARCYVSGVVAGLPRDHLVAP